MENNLAAKLQCSQNVLMDESEQRPISPNPRRISTFVAFDLETTGLPYLKTRVGITELSMFCFAAAALESESSVTQESATSLPETPRVLHKLTLLFNPRRIVEEGAERITGLNNYILEHESPFDENAGTLLNSFMKHLKQPICLVAHNGDQFDFPLLKQSLKKLDVQFPSDTLCVDSLRAFWGIEEQIRAITPVIVVDENESKTQEQNNSFMPIVDGVTMQTQSQLEITSESKIDETIIDWQKINEATPKRSTTANNGRANCKRQSVFTDNNNHTPSAKRRLLDETFKSRRVLFPNKPTAKYPPRGKYKLSALYERVFGQSPKVSHCAEADVDALTKLMLAHGVDFLAYAENHAIPFAEIRAWNE